MIAMPRCRVCGAPASYRVPWANAWFCPEHFSRYFERKVSRVYERYVPRSVERILLAVSGGKDSVAMLYASARVVGGEKELGVLFIDLGIPGYSEEARVIVEHHAHRLGLPFHVADIRGYGFTIGDAARLAASGRLGRPVCSICGVAKRYIMNRYAVEHGYDAVATGHTMDDILGFYLAGLSSREGLRSVAKLSPYTGGGEKLAARIRPLYFLTDAESAMYVEANGLEILGSKCPFAPRRRGEGLRLTIKEALENIDRRHPGYRVMLARTLADHVSGILYSALGPGETRRCSICGYPSSTDPCGFCRIRLRIHRLLGEKQDTGSRHP